MRQREAYSYQTDPTVPDFEWEKAFAVIDSQCAFCVGVARWICHQDRKELIKIIPLQTPLGRAMMAHYGLDPEDPESWIFVEDGLAYFRLDGGMKLGKCLGGFWRIISLFRIFPRPVRTWGYRLVARNRYRLFGYSDLCTLPDPEVQKRLIIQ